MQCSSRWRNDLNPSIALTAGSTGAWTTGEIIKLKAAVQSYGGKDWVAIAALVPGRTKRQCWNRWKTHGTPTVAQSWEKNKALVSNYLGTGVYPSEEEATP
jgi:hypothetical protein